MQHILVTGSCLVDDFNNLLGLLCDCFDHGSDHSWGEPVDSAIIVPAEQSSRGNMKWAPWGVGGGGG